jgi:hypothetical protein
MHRNGIYVDCTEAGSGDSNLIVSDVKCREYKNAFAIAELVGGDAGRLLLHLDARTDDYCTALVRKDSTDAASCDGALGVES